MAKYVTSLYDDYAGSRELPPDAGLDVQMLNSRLAEIGGEARLFDLADWDETEDLACTFLQSQGWRLQKSFASRSQPKIECVFLKAEGNTSSIALIQVKSGKERIDVSSFVELARRYTSVYLFSTASDPYSNIPDPLPKEIELLERSKIFDYFKRNPLELPRSLQRKLNSQV
ncbi:MAG TPA: hypothetical protein VFC46_09260 [Humisphaera sp.]|nr:hypothetical protein [Humisphaera sp.]